jgi:zinc D-Ala-D-Ala carboxypeptidase
MDGKPLTINSGFRCLTHNRTVGSKDTSQHPKGMACDISGKGRDIDDMATRASDFFNKVIIYSWGIHVDVRK